MSTTASPSSPNQAIQRSMTSWDGFSGVHATSAIAGHCRLTNTPTRRHLQDLTAHGVVDLVGEEPERWIPSAWLREHWWAVGGSKGAGS